MRPTENLRGSEDTAESAQGAEVSEKTDEADTRSLERIQSLMGEILRKSSNRDGDCLYRGEPECYPIVSSGLYRKCRDSENEAFEIRRVEQEIVESARQYTILADDDEILAEIQHFGGTTNLVDVTDDYLIALLFASAGSDPEYGRVVLHWPEPGTVERPKQTNNRIVFQKSVFVRPGRGFIVPDAREEIVVIPGDLKPSIVSFLARFHGISARSVYNDIHGFIRHQNPGGRRYAGEFRKAVEHPRSGAGHNLWRCLEAEMVGIDPMSMRHSYHQRGMVYADGKGSLFTIHSVPTMPGPTTVYTFELVPEEVVDLYTHFIENKRYGMRMEDAHCARGEAHLFLGADGLALRDFESALQRSEKLAGAYHGAGAMPTDSRANPIGPWQTSTKPCVWIRA